MYTLFSAEDDIQTTHYGVQNVTVTKKTPPIFPPQIDGMKIALSRRSCMAKLNSFFVPLAGNVREKGTRRKEY
jgi:hypothetical protein